MLDREMEKATRNAEEGELRLLVRGRKKEEGSRTSEEESGDCGTELGLVRATAPSSQSSVLTGQCLTKEAFCVSTPLEQQQLWVGFNQVA